jgi:cyclopropane fatty-acyl-phospholipid synthase-like methyltransferase
MTKTIYTDKETESAVEFLNKFDPDFKLARFFKDKVLDRVESISNKMKDKTFLKLRLLELESDQIKSLKKLEEFKSKIQSIDDNVTKETENDKIKKENYESKLKNCGVAICQYFIVPKKELRKLADEFYNGRHGINILYKFVESKRFKKKILKNEM